MSCERAFRGGEMKQKLFIVLIMVSFFGCTYRSNLKNDFHDARGYSSDLKSPLKIAILQDNSIRTQAYRFKPISSRELIIELYPGLIHETKEELDNIFEHVRVVDYLAQVNDEQLVVCVEMEPELTKAHYDGPQKYDIENKLKIIFKDIKTDEVVEEFIATDTLLYRPPFLDYVTDVPAVLSLGILSFITYPTDTFVCGLKTKKLLENSISRMLTTLSEQIVSDRTLLAYAGKSYGTKDWPKVTFSKDDINQYIDNNRSSLDPVEGIWTYSRDVSIKNTSSGDETTASHQTDYEIAIVKKDLKRPREFVGVIMSSTVPHWDYPGRIKARLKATARQGEYTVKWYNSEYKLETSYFHFDSTGNLIGWFDDWKRFENTMQRNKASVRLIKIYPPMQHESSYKTTSNVKKKDSDRSGNGYDHFLDSTVVIKTPRPRGSGFLVTQDGYVVTNQHVVKKNKVVNVKFRDGRMQKGSVLAADEERDLALVKLAGKEYQYIPVGTVSGVHIGEDVVAVGAPEGILQWSLTKGVISAVRYQNRDSRKGLRLVDFDPANRQVINAENNICILQSDIAINKGNSGGPLIDIDSGKVVGVNTFRYYDNEAATEGLNFAIAADEIQKAFSLYLK